MFDRKYIAKIIQKKFLAISHNVNWHEL